MVESGDDRHVGRGRGRDRRGLRRVHFFVGGQGRAKDIQPLLLPLSLSLSFYSSRLPLTDSFCAITLVENIPSKFSRHRVLSLLTTHTKTLHGPSESRTRVP